METLAKLQTGDHILVLNADGNVIPKRALSPVVAGGSFDVVWACREEEWQAALTEGRAPEGMPWPATDVHLAEAAVPQ